MVFEDTMEIPQWIFAGWGGWGATCSRPAAIAWGCRFGYGKWPAMDLAVANWLILIEEKIYNIIIGTME